MKPSLPRTFSHFININIIIVILIFMVVLVVFVYGGITLRSLVSEGGSGFCAVFLLLCVSVRGASSVCL